MRLSFTDTAIISVIGGMYMGVVGMGLISGGAILVESIDEKINPRTPEYLANKKKNQLLCWIKEDKNRIVEKQKKLDSLKKYKDSEYKLVTERDIKFEIEYIKGLLDRWEHEKSVLEFAFIPHQEPAPLMPVEMGYRKLFFEMI